MANTPEKPVVKETAPKRARQQSKKTTATPVNFSFDEKPFKRCGYCGDVKAQCRAEKRCVKGLM